MIAGLHQYFRNLVESAPASTVEYEIELDSDPRLKYEHLIAAVTAVSGYCERTGDSEQIIPLVETIRFRNTNAPREKMPAD